MLLDAGVWVALIDPNDAYHLHCAALVRAAVSDETRAAALDLTLYEVANVCVRRWGAADAGELLQIVLRICADTLVRVDADLLEAASELAARHRLTVYDAAYVAAARSHGWQLVSCDMKDLVEPGFAVAPDAVA